MEPKHVKHFKSHRKGIIAFWSLVLIVTLFFFLKNAGFLTSMYLSALFTWPLILFCISIVCFFAREWIAGLVFLAGAKFFWFPYILRTDPNLFPFLSADGFIQRYWYILLIFIAFILIIKHIFWHESRCEKKCHWSKFESNVHEIKEGFIRSDVVFSSNEKIYMNDNFKGGRFSTVFGSQEIDLRKCVIPSNEKAHVEINTVFGNCLIWVPTDWTVQINTETVISSFEDKRLQTPPTAESDVLVIDGKCVFSGLEIRS